MIEFVIFAFGAAVGSFLNVAIFRLGTGEKLVNSRSRCLKCGQVLRWYDLIPIASFFVLRGRCRACGGRISAQYPIVEAATGLLFIAVYQFIGSSVHQFSGYWLLAICYWLFVVSSLVVIFVYDLRHYIIPDVVLWPAIGVSLMWQVFLSLEIGYWDLVGHWKLIIGHFGPYFLAALGAAAFFLILVLITRGRGMGLGDVKLALLMGLILGWPNILIALFLAFFLGALVGVGLVVAGKKTLKSQVPFGPFLVAGTLVALFWGKTFWDFIQKTGLY